MRSMLTWGGVLAGSVALGVGMYGLVVAPATGGLDVLGITAAPEERPTVLRTDRKPVPDRQARTGSADVTPVVNEGSNYDEAKYDAPEYESEESEPQESEPQEYEPQEPKEYESQEYEPASAASRYSGSEDDDESSEDREDSEGDDD